MKKLYFLPEWYIKSQETSKIRILKIFIIIFFLIDIVLTNIYLFNINKTKVIEKEIRQLSGMQEESNISSNNSKVRNNSTGNTFFVFYKEILSNTNFQSIYIEGNNIIMNLNAKTIDYNSLINNIEKNNKFTIKQISSLSDSQGNQYYNINLKLKEGD